MTPLFLDTETFSPVPLEHGLASYSTQVEVIIVTWALGDGPVHTWDVTRGEPLPEQLHTDLAACDRLVAHNAQFDRTVLAHQSWWPGDVIGAPWYCTMTAALRHGLPGGLDKLSTVFRLDDKTGKLDGKKFINLFCKLQKGGERNTRHTHPEEWRDFLKYAARDINSMRAAYHKMPKWNDSDFELDLTELDYTINMRGIAVDLTFATNALRATTEEQKRLADRTEELTDGSVLRATQRDRLLAFLFAEHGVDLPNLKADTVERRLNDPELPEHVKELLRLRQEASKSSTSKYKRLLKLQVLGRLHFLLQVYGALRTGRWGGRNFQPQNLPRPKLKWQAILTAIDAINAGAEEFVLDNIMEAASSALRSVLIAGPGRKLVVSDLANIEGRFLAWIANEDWKLDAFAAFDRGDGPDLYKLAYARSFDVTPESVGDDSQERQIGKVMELALGYQGGVAAFMSMAAGYGMDLEQLAERAYGTIPRPTLADAEGTWQWAIRKGRTLGLPQKVYVVCEALKTLWRQAHPETTALWASVEQAARGAILNPGVAFQAGRLVFDRQGAWLRMKLPSGRYLLYPNPKVDGNQIQFAAWNVYTKTWRHESTYGGKLVENACQAGSRDVMAGAMPEAEAAGYPIVLSVHDELVTEPIDSSEYTAKALSEILAAGAPWTEGLPLAAKGFESQRYRKG